MASSDDRELEAAAALEPEELSSELANEIAERWDPERILKLVAKRAGRGDTLDATLRHRYEKRLGVDLGHVRVYTGELAEEVNKQYNSHAVTIGNTGMILMGGTAQKSMASVDGEALLAHELTHVAQASRGLHYDKADTSTLATNEHNEAQARAVQAEVAGGGGNQAEHDQEAAQQAEHLREMVIARVLDMLGEAGRVMLNRGGPFPRRA
jgi:hypothetical protein